MEILNILRSISELDFNRISCGNWRELLFKFLSIELLEREFFFFWVKIEIFGYSCFSVMWSWFGRIEMITSFKPKFLGVMLWLKWCFVGLLLRCGCRLVISLSEFLIETVEVTNDSSWRFPVISYLEAHLLWEFLNFKFDSS